MSTKGEELHFHALIVIQKLRFKKDGFSGGKIYQTGINTKTNEIVISEYDELYRTKLIIKNYYFVDIEEVNPNVILHMKVHYRLRETPCKIEISDIYTAEVELLKPVAMIANGQTAVFYDKERLVGGGFIESSE